MSFFTQQAFDEDEDDESDDDEIDFESSDEEGPIQPFSKTSSKLPIVAENKKESVIEIKPITSLIPVNNNNSDDIDWDSDGTSFTVQTHKTNIPISSTKIMNKSMTTTEIKKESIIQRKFTRHNPPNTDSLTQSFNKINAEIDDIFGSDSDDLPIQSSKILAPPKMLPIEPMRRKLKLPQKRKRNQTKTESIIPAKKIKLSPIKQQTKMKSISMNKPPQIPFNSSMAIDIDDMNTDDDIFGSDSDDIPIQRTHSSANQNNKKLKTKTLKATPYKSSSSLQPIKTTKMDKPTNSEQSQFVLPSNQHLNHKNNKRKKNKKKKPFKFRQQIERYGGYKNHKKHNKNHKLFGHENAQNDWKKKAGIMSTKVSNKQAPPAHPKSALNITERTQYVTLRQKEHLLNDEEREKYEKLCEIVKNEQNIYRKWLMNFYKGKDIKHDDHIELNKYAKLFQSKRAKKSGLNYLELTNNLKYNQLAYFYIHQCTLKQIEKIIKIKQDFVKNKYAKKYIVQQTGVKLKEQRMTGIKCEKSSFEFLANLCNNNGKIPQWMISNKYFNRSYNDQIICDVMPSNLSIFDDAKDGKLENETKKIQNLSSPHIVYTESEIVSKDEMIDSVLQKNANSKAINVILCDAVMSLLIDINAKNEWKQSFMLPFVLKVNAQNTKNKILFLDEPCLRQEWRRRYSNHIYFEHVFRSYLCQNFMVHQMKGYEMKIGQNKNEKFVQQMSEKQQEWNDFMQQSSKNPHFVYAMWRLNTLHCLIRTQIYGQLQFANNVRSHCFGAIKLDYLNQHKQAFITHHIMNNEQRKQNAEDKNEENSLRNAESMFYGVERLTETERMRLFIQTQLRANNKLIIGRVQIPSRKLMSVNIIDHNMLLKDESEHVNLHKRYQDALGIMDRLFQFLLNDSKCEVGRQYLLAYDHTSDSMNIFAEDVKKKTDKDAKNERKSDETTKKEAVKKMTDHVNGKSDVQIKKVGDVKTENGIKKESEIKIEKEGQNESVAIVKSESTISTNQSIETKEENDSAQDTKAKEENNEIKIDQEPEPLTIVKSEKDIPMKAVEDSDSSQKDVKMKEDECESKEEEEANKQLFDFHGYIDEFCGKLNDTKIDYIPPYSIRYRGTMKQSHIPDIPPPANSDLPRPCQMFLFHGYCPKYHAAQSALRHKQQQNNQKNGDGNKKEEHNKINNANNENLCEFPHYRTHILSHCWEYALYGGHCERGSKCEWPHLREQELVNKGMQMFHVRQLINYCQDYYKKGRCKNTQNGGKCPFIHLNEKQLMFEFHTKYKNKQMRPGQLLRKGRILEKNLRQAQYQQLPGQQKKTYRSKKKYNNKGNKNGTKQKKNTPIKTNL